MIDGFCGFCFDMNIWWCSIVFRMLTSGYLLYKQIMGLPSANQTWLDGKSPITGSLSRKIYDKWSIFQQGMFDQLTEGIVVMIL